MRKSKHLIFSLIVSLILAVTALAQGVSTNNLLTRKCPASNLFAKVEIDKQGNINFAPCATKNLLLNGLLFGGGGGGTMNSFFVQTDSGSGAKVNVVEGNTIQLLGTAGNITVTNAGLVTTLNLPNSGATAGTYGSATQIPVFQVDAKGRITTINTVAASVPAHDASLITTGTIAPLRLGSGTPTASTYLGGDSTWKTMPSLPASGVVGLTETQTLTNKTLTSPTISTILNTGTLTLPTSTDTLVGRATTDTLTNKTLTSPVINVGSDATGDLHYRNSGGAFARLPIGSNGQVLTISGGLPAWGTVSANLTQPVENFNSNVGAVTAVNQTEFIDVSNGTSATVVSIPTMTNGQSYTILAYDNANYGKIKLTQVGQSVIYQDGSFLGSITASNSISCKGIYRVIKTNFGYYIDAPPARCTVTA